MEINELFLDLFAKIDGVRTEKMTAGTRFRLMAVVADVAEVTQMLQAQVLDVVSHEAVVDADVDIDFAELAEEVLAQELQEVAEADEQVLEQTRLVNETLGALNAVLVQISEQLERHHKDEEFERLYEAEKRRYMSSGTAHRARKTFEEWKDYECYGHPMQENIEDYRMGKVLQMFEKGVFNMRMEQMQRAKRYPGELDFEQLEDDHPLKKTVHRHYAVLRKLVDWSDGCLVVNAARVGRHFYACRHEENAKANRTNFLKYMHKVSLAQEELRRLGSAEQKTAQPRANVPDRLRTTEATEMMSSLVDAGLLTADWQPKALSGSERGLVAKTVSDRLEIKEVWQVFGKLWDERPETLRGYLNKALEQKKSLEFQDRLKNILD